MGVSQGRDARPDSGRPTLPRTDMSVQDFFGARLLAGVAIRSNAVAYIHGSVFFVSKQYIRSAEDNHLVGC